MKAEGSRQKAVGFASRTFALSPRRFLADRFFRCLLPTAFCLLLAWPPAARTQESGGRELLETGRPAAVEKQAGAAAELKVISYNIRWRGGEDLQEVIKLLRADPELGGATIIGLQEVDRDKKRTKNVNTARVIADALRMHYAWAAPPVREGEEETGVALLSPHPLTDVVRLVLPHEGPGGRRRVAVGATVHAGRTQVRAYSVHAETRMPLAKKVEHWRAVLEDLARHQRIPHAVIVGDFNTIKGKDVRAARRLFTEAGFTTPFPDDRATFKVFFFDFKLDWVWLRGFDHGDFGIATRVDLSDHWPLWAKASLRRRDAAPKGAAADSGTR
ncbi:MAG TPA: endonuclease/exonuclease/phosphatase family protein [Pyrinomonadaceae bacterium]|nr:endonuclease/exonuclease/phosphatase family protein [Pyrinomonadaceae bacterium]